MLNIFYMAICLIDLEMEINLKISRRPGKRLATAYQK